MTHQDAKVRPGATVRCANCDRQNRVEVARDLAGRMKLVKVDIARAPKTQARFDVMAVPTLLLLRNGTVVDRRSGAAPAAALRAWVEQALAENP
jgi:thioredoxin-like negative regulator of GroEL